MYKKIIGIISILVLASCVQNNKEYLKAEDIVGNISNKTIIMIQETGVKDAAYLSSDNKFYYAKNAKLPVIVKNWSVKKGALCFSDDCYKIYKQPPHLYLRSVEEGKSNIHVTKITAGDPLKLIQSVNKK